MVFYPRGTAPGGGGTQSAVGLQSDDGALGEGTPDELRTYVLSNTATGDFAEVIWESGGRLEQLQLNGHSVLITHENNATMVRGHKMSCFSSWLWTYDYGTRTA